MPYIDFNAHLKKVNLKPKGIKEIVLEISDDGLDGKMEDLSRMIDHKVEIQFDSLVVNYNVNIDVKTNEAIKQYEVDQHGTVKAVNEIVPVENAKVVETEIEREVIDNFIMEGLSPVYENLPADFDKIVIRKLKGESYSSLATELGISSGAIVDVIDEYRKKIAPLAKAWWDWKENKEDTE